MANDDPNNGAGDPAISTAVMTAAPGETTTTRLPEGADPALEEHVDNVRRLGDAFAVVLLNNPHVLAALQSALASAVRGPAVDAGLVPTPFGSNPQPGALDPNEQAGQVIDELQHQTGLEAAADAHAQEFPVTVQGRGAAVIVDVSEPRGVAIVRIVGQVSASADHVELDFHQVMQLTDALTYAEHAIDPGDTEEQHES